MNLILVDTSVWINAFKGIETQASLYLKNNIENIVVSTCPVVVQEVLQGISGDKDFNHTENYFSNLVSLPSGNSYALAVQAASLFRKLRKKGITIRKPNDCLIACYALNHKVSLLHDDVDFNSIAKYTALELVFSHSFR